MKILLLAGTAEARALARRLAGRDGVSMIASLAGATANPAPYPGPVRVGGFGGAAGLADYLRAESVDLVIDATHPFAQRMTSNAATAADRAGVARLRLLRPPWRPKPGDDWRTASDIDAAAAATPLGVCVFLALGRGGLSPFAKRADLKRIARVLDPNDAPGWAVPIVGAPGPDAETEAATFRRFGVDIVVAKNAGGQARAKLDAARALGLPTILVRRPPEPPGDVVETVDAAERCVMERMETGR